MKRVKLLFFLGLLLCSQYLSAQNKQRLINNWEYLQGDLGGIWEAIRPAKEGSPETVPLWQNVNLPHCFNALNSVDPDENY